MWLVSKRDQPLGHDQQHASISRVTLMHRRGHGRQQLQIGRPLNAAATALTFLPAAQTPVKRSASMLEIKLGAGIQTGAI